jgi:hypothetical protein
MIKVIIAAFYFGKYVEGCIKNGFHIKATPGPLPGLLDHATFLT